MQLTQKEQQQILNVSRGEDQPSGVLPCSGAKRPVFVNIDGAWVNPEYVVSVQHHDGDTYTPQSVVVQMVAGTLNLNNWTPREACGIVDKLEGNSSH